MPATIRQSSPAGSSRSRRDTSSARSTGDEPGPEPRDLLGELLDRAPGGERHDPEPVRAWPRRRRATERPIEPVEPRMDRVFMANRSLYRGYEGAGHDQAMKAATTGPAKSSESIRS